MAEILKLKERNKVAENSSINTNALQSKPFPNNSDEYNTEYTNWRKSDSSYTYYYTPTNDEYTYMDGAGYINDNPKEKETRAIYKINSLFGIAILISLVMETICKYILINILKLGDTLFTWDIFSGYMNCPESDMVIISITTGILKFAFPIVFLLIMLRLPYPVFASSNGSPIKELKKFGNFLPILIMMFIIALVCDITLISELNIINPNKYSISYFLPDDTMYQVDMMIYYFMIVPLMKSFLLSGLMLQPLRQFSDEYAIIMTSIFAALLSHNLSVIGHEFFMCLVISFITIKTGSIASAVISNSIVQICQYLLFRFVDTQIDSTITIFLLVLVLSVLVLTCTFSKKTFDKIKDIFFLSRNNTKSTISEKYSSSFLNPGMILILIISVLLQILILGFDRII